MTSLRVTTVVDRNLPPQKVISQNFYRVSKYIFPRSRLAWNLWGAPAPTKVATLEELLKLYPESIEQFDAGRDHGRGQVTFRTLQNGELKDVQAPPEREQDLRVFSLVDATSVGRHSTLLGPDNTLVADFGYYLPQADPGQRRWSDVFNIKFWRSRWLMDMRFRRQLPAIARLKGSAALLNNPWCHNYYHWLLEVAPRVMLLRQLGLDADWYVVDCTSGYQKQALELMGIPAERCIQPHYGLHLRADRLLRPSYPGVTQCEMMADTIRSNVPEVAGIPSSRRIYISRKTAAHRKLVNESELEQVLKAYGFESYSFDRVSFADQVRVMRSAECIVTVHGAALANLIFARPGTRVIEICPVGRYNVDCFPRISQKFGHHHLSIMAPSTRYRQNLSVDLRDIQLSLEYHGLRQTEGRGSQRAKAA